MSNTNMNIRVDNKIKNQAKEIFAELGIDMTTAVNIFLRQAIREHGIPFNLKLEIPNEETRRAIRDAENGIGVSQVFESVDKLMEDLNA